MKMLILEELASGKLVVGEGPVSPPAVGEVLVRVHAAGVTPTELSWYPTTHTKAGEPRRQAVPGHEFSGVVGELGAGVTEFQVGEAVYGMNDWFANGATAEYCLTVPASIAAKPSRLSHAEAATVPISALTAWQGLYDRVQVRAGQRVLVHGGSGAVGVFAIQLAARVGAQVFTTASVKHADFLEQLGASHVIDYHSQRFEEVVSDVDVVFDAVGGDTLRRSWPVLTPEGRLVTVASSSGDAQDAATKAAFFIVEPRQEQLSVIAKLLDAGQLKACLDGTVPLAAAAEAYAGKTPRPNGRGKLAVVVAE